LNRLSHLMVLAKESLEIKRKALDNFMEKGLYPYSRHYLEDVKKMRDSYFGNHFSTIGIMGMNESLLNFLGEDVTTEKGRKFAIEILDFMRAKMIEFQEETGNLYNLEATPGEGSLAPEEKVLISQSDPKLLEIGPLVDKYFYQEREKIIKIGTSEVLPLPAGEMFTYGFNRDNLKIKKYPVTSLVRHQGRSMHEINTVSGRRIKVTGQHSIFTLNKEGIPQEILVSNIQKGDLMAIPKKIEMEQINKEINLIEVFKNSPVKNKLYVVFPSEIIQKLTSLNKVKEWVEKNYKDEWKDVKYSWRKSKIFPLKCIYDLDINFSKKTLKLSKLFYRATKNTKSINILIPLDRKFGFLLGSLLAEGWINERPEFSNTDKNFAEKVFKISQEIFGKNSAKIFLKKRVGGRKDQYLVVLSKMAGLVFKEFNLFLKSNEKRIPEFIFFASSECAAGILEGFYLGDGCLCENKKKRDISVQLSTSSSELVEGLNILFLRFGILTKIREKDKSVQNPSWKKNYILSVSGAENLKKFCKDISKEKITINENNSGREILPYLPRIMKLIMKKYSITPEKIDIHKDSFNRNIRQNRISIQYFKEILRKLAKVIPAKEIKSLKNLAYSDLYWDKVKEINKIKVPQYVYDLEVEVDKEKVNNFLGGKGLVCLHNTSYRQAKTDKEKYPDIITAGTKEVPYYTNSSQLPVGFTDDVFQALDLQNDLQTKYTGGTVLHVFLGEKVSDPNMAKNLVKKIFEKYSLPYITLTPTFSICPTHGYLSGEHFECPQCTIKQPCEVYSRVVGYIRPVQQWHKGKQTEYEERKEFILPTENAKKAIVPTEQKVEA
ncbi:MAG: anaerobic ribonucleoside-triphosphate reductase, partial [bacterium]